MFEVEKCDAVLRTLQVVEHRICMHIEGTTHKITNSALDAPKTVTCGLNRHFSSRKPNQNLPFPDRACVLRHRSAHSDDVLHVMAAITDRKINKFLARFANTVNKSVQGASNF